MYICLCQGVTDKEIRKAVAKGSCSMNCLKRNLGVGTQCGKCCQYAQEILDDSLGQKSNSQCGNAIVLQPIEAKAS